MSENNSIQLVQSPIIKHTLESVGEKVTARITALGLEKQVATEATITTLKNTRAELNKEAKDFEAQRKTIKEAVMNPYAEFEDIYKSEILTKYKEADDLLKSKINDFEMKVKTEKRDSLILYFKELVEMEQIEWLSFDRLNIDVNLSTSEKKYKEQILSSVQKIVDDINLISTETFSAEMLVEFKKNLNASQSIQSVRKRKEDERLEAERLKSDRTNQRRRQIQSLTFVYHDLTRTFNWIHDESVMVTLGDLENLPNDEWVVKFVELESKTKQDQPEEEKPQILQAPTVENQEQPKEEKICEAKFLVSGTYEQLKALGEFLKSNNYKYQNID